MFWTTRKFASGLSKRPLDHRARVSASARSRHSASPHTSLEALAEGQDESVNATETKQTDSRRNLFIARSSPAFGEPTVHRPKRPNTVLFFTEPARTHLFEQAALELPELLGLSASAGDASR
jgi:DsbC/DsbD-like thiol-disulfide interchange protein